MSSHEREKEKKGRKGEQRREKNMMREGDMNKSKLRKQTSFITTY